MYDDDDYDDDEEEFDVEETDEEEGDEEDLSDYSDETIKAAEKRTAALADGWSIGGIAQLLDYTPVLVSAIEEGVFDGPEIKAIITACMKRRDIVLGSAGKSTVTKRRTRTASTSTNGRKPKKDLGPVNPDKGTARWTGQVLGEGGIVIQPLASYVSAGRTNFEAGGRRYSKSEMIGKVVRLPKTFDPWYLGGQLVRIRNVRSVGIEVDLVENPEFVHPNSTELRRPKFVVGYTFEVKAIDIQHIFDV